MNEWLDEYIVNRIVNIISKLKNARFEQLEAEGAFFEGAMPSLRFALIDLLNENALEDITVPSVQDIIERGNLLEINPKEPDSCSRRLEYELIIEDEVSDVTVVFYLYKKCVDAVKIYDVLVL